MIRRGAMVVIEGADRVGKSTHAAQLVEKLQELGHPAKYLKFPDRTTVIGKIIDEYLKKSQTVDDHVIHLLFSANRWEWFERMKCDLESGTNLIVDRYAFSGVAYSAAKPGMNLTWCKQPDCGLIKPDLVLYLTASNDTVSQRPGFGDEIYEAADFQSKVKQNYDLLIEDNWKEVCTDSLSTNSIHDTLLQSILTSINDSSCKPIDFLWIDNVERKSNGIETKKRKTIDNNFDCEH